MDAFVNGYLGMITGLKPRSNKNNNTKDNNREPVDFIINFSIFDEMSNSYFWRHHRATQGTAEPD